MVTLLVTRLRIAKLLLLQSVCNSQVTQVSTETVEYTRCALGQATIDTFCSPRPTEAKNESACSSSLRTPGVKARWKSVRLFTHLALGDSPVTPCVSLTFRTSQVTNAGESRNLPPSGHWKPLVRVQKVGSWNRLSNSKLVSRQWSRASVGISCKLDLGLG